MAQRPARQLDLPMSLKRGCQAAGTITQMQASCTCWQEYAQELERAMYAIRAERDAARREAQDFCGFKLTPPNSCWSFRAIGCVRPQWRFRPGSVRNSAGC